MIATIRILYLAGSYPKTYVSLSQDKRALSFDRTKDEFFVSSSSYCVLNNKLFSVPQCLRGDVNSLRREIRSNETEAYIP
jgi:hypothetical protein